MAKKLFGKKKKAAAATPAATTNGNGPIITQLDALPADSPLKKRLGLKKAGPTDMATILGYDPRTMGTLG